jgi:hypothetical protein
MIGFAWLAGGGAAVGGLHCRRAIGNRGVAHGGQTGRALAAKDPVAYRGHGLMAGIFLRQASPSAADETCTKGSNNRERGEEPNVSS